jgi:hypothetical protein
MKRLFPLYSGLQAQVKLKIIYHISQGDAGEMFGIIEIYYKMMHRFQRYYLYLDLQIPVR